MATATVISMAEYLGTTYRPDREYVDGDVRERNVGKWDHARLQTLLAVLLSNRYEAELGVLAAVEWRVQVSSTRVRIPNVVLVLAGPQPEVLVEPPLLVVEILSPDDSYSDTQQRAQDYLRMGVGTIWILDPKTATARQIVDDVWRPANALDVPGTPIRVDVAELFGKLRG